MPRAGTLRRNNVPGKTTSPRTGKMIIFRICGSRRPQNAIPAGDSNLRPLCSGVSLQRDKVFLLMNLLMGSESRAIHCRLLSACAWSIPLRPALALPVMNGP